MSKLINFIKRRYYQLVSSVDDTFVGFDDEGYKVWSLNGEQFYYEGAIKYLLDRGYSHQQAREYLNSLVSKLVVNC